MDEPARVKVRRHAFTLAVEEGLRRCGVRAGDRLLLGVSGGADSVSLLIGGAALSTLKQWSLDLHVGHVQHHLRANAEHDAAFVRDLSASHALPFHRRDVHPSGKGQNLEASARKLRYGALLEVAREIDADAVVTAHHRRDQLETVLMRLVRGASVRGIGGMPSRRRLEERVLIRPMLDIDPDQGLAMLEMVGQGWCMDETNLDLSRQRAKLRSTVVPSLSAVHPAAAAKACDTARRLRESARLIARLARSRERRHVKNVSDREAVMDRAAARRLPRELLAIILRSRAVKIGVPGDRLGSRIIDQMADAVRDGKGVFRTFPLAGGGRVEVSVDRVRWVLEA